MTLPVFERYGLLGYPLTHSFSQQVHKMLSECSYDMCNVEPQMLKNFFETNQLDAFNVTIPYKQSVIPYLHFISNEAKEINAVNTVIKIDGKYYGYNTDIFGFLDTIKRNHIEVNDKQVVILGSGGASKAVKAALMRLNPKSITVVSRNGEINYNTVYQAVPGAQIIINATPVGTYPHIFNNLLNLSMFHKLTDVIDLTYNPLRTKLLLEAEELGINTINGLEMLVSQANYSRKLFDGKYANDDVISDIVKKMTKTEKNIVLIGMPGSGKTMIGKMLSQALNMPFADTDEAISEEYGQSPENIIISEGEDYFRQKEADIIERYAKEHGKIIATGGGCVTNDKNYYTLKSNGTVFWIVRDLENLCSDNRPLSQRYGIDLIYQNRKDLYKRFCDYTVNNNGKPHEAVNQIIKEWECENSCH